MTLNISSAIKLKWELNADAVINGYEVKNYAAFLYGGPH